MQLKDLTGMRFGKLEVLSRVESDSRGQTRWRVKCDCGKETIAASRHLTSGSTASCGCGVLIAVIKKLTTHGGSNSRLYRTFRGMITRTSNQNRKDYPRYGGRGIKVCDEWKNNFATFRDWAMANGYDDSLSIDRINNDGNYEPSNCRWVDIKVQNGNTRKNHLLAINGERFTIAEWGRKLGINCYLISTRLRRGWPVERALELV